MRFGAWQSHAPEHSPSRQFMPRKRQTVTVTVFRSNQPATRPEGVNSPTTGFSPHTPPRPRHAVATNVRIGTEPRRRQSPFAPFYTRKARSAILQQQIRGTGYSCSCTRVRGGSLQKNSLSPAHAPVLHATLRVAHLTREVEPPPVYSTAPEREPQPHTPSYTRAHMTSRSDCEPLPKPTLSPSFALARPGTFLRVGFFTAAAWCVPALRVPLVHSLINHFRQN